MKSSHFRMSLFKETRYKPSVDMGVRYGRNCVFLCRGGNLPPANCPYGFYGGSFYIVGAIHESPAVFTADNALH